MYLAQLSGSLQLSRRIVSSASPNKSSGSHFSEPTTFSLVLTISSQQRLCSLLCSVFRIIIFSLPGIGRPTAMTWSKGGSRFSTSGLMITKREKTVTERRAGNESLNRVPSIPKKLHV